MVDSLVYSLLRALVDLLVTGRADQAKLQAEVLVLRRQVQVLERQIKRVQWKPTDRMLLAALRERIPRSGWAGLLVKPETVLGWHRALVRRKWAAYYSRPRRGRRPISAECRQLILRMAREYPGWGYFRIRGELLKVGHRVAATTIRSVLLATGVPPSGQRSQLTWKQFLAAHAETLAAADFFSVDTIFFKRLYVLIYVHLASRRVWGSINTSNSSPAHISGRSPRPDRIPGRVIGSLFYSLLRVLLDALATKYGRHAELQAKVLALRRQVQVLERQIKRVHWSPGDRMVLAALRDRIPRSAGQDYW